MSPKYTMMKIDYHDKLEEANKTVIRRSSPCPSEYKTYGGVIFTCTVESCITLPY